MAAAERQAATQAVGEACQTLLDKLEAELSHREGLALLEARLARQAAEAASLATLARGEAELDVSVVQQQAHGWDPDPGALFDQDVPMTPSAACQAHPQQQQGPAPGEEAAWAQFHQLPPLQQEDGAMQQKVAALRDRLRRISYSPSDYALPPDWGGEDWQAWLDELSALLPDPAHFQAHSLRQHYPAWEALLGDRERRPSRDVLRMIREGIRFKWRQPNSPHQQQHPRWRQNLQRIERAIAQVYGADRVASFLEAPEPQPIHLPNHQSISKTAEHAAFTGEQISKLESTGAARRWPFQRPPRVVLPLGVATNSAGKLRLVLDGGYVNLWAGERCIGLPHRAPGWQSARLGHVPTASLAQRMPSEARADQHQAGYGARAEQRSPAAMTTQLGARVPAEYQPFKYEQLADITTYLEQGDWGIATDATSGFHHFSLHPDVWEYAAFQSPEGQYYVFTGGPWHMPASPCSGESRLGGSPRTCLAPGTPPPLLLGL